MADENRKSPSKDGSYPFRVSDSFAVPLRGHMLRLKVVADGAPSMKALSAGGTLHVASPAGAARDVTIIGHGATGGRATQKRLEATGELDVVISKADAGEGSDQIGIGWFAGPA